MTQPCSANACHAGQYNTSRLDHAIPDHACKVHMCNTRQRIVHRNPGRQGPAAGGDPISISQARVPLSTRSMSTSIIPGVARGATVGGITGPTALKCRSKSLSKYRRPHTGNWLTSADVNNPAIPKYYPEKQYIPTAVQYPAL